MCEKLFEGHVDYCFTCIPLNIGTHIIGVLQVLYAIRALYQTILIFMVPDFYLAQFLGFVGIFVTMFICWPAVEYFQLLACNTSENKHHFADAYKSFSMIMVIDAGIIVGIYEVIMFWLANNQDSDAKQLIIRDNLIVLGSYLIYVFTTFHFSKVLSSFAKEGQNQDEYYVKAGQYRLN